MRERSVTRAWPHSSQLPHHSSHVHGSASGTQSELGGGSGGGRESLSITLTLQTVERRPGFENSLWFPGRTKGGGTLGSPDFCNHWPEENSTARLASICWAQLEPDSGCRPGSVPVRISSLWIVYIGLLLLKESRRDRDEKTNGLAGEWGLAQSKKTGGSSGCARIQEVLGRRSANPRESRWGHCPLKAPGRKKTWGGIQTSEEISHWRTGRL